MLSGKLLHNLAQLYIKFSCLALWCGKLLQLYYAFPTKHRPNLWQWSTHNAVLLLWLANIQLQCTWGKWSRFHCNITASRTEYAASSLLFCSLAISVISALVQKYLNAEFPEKDNWDSCWMNMCCIWKQEMKTKQTAIVAVMQNIYFWRILNYVCNFYDFSESNMPLLEQKISLYYHRNRHSCLHDTMHTCNSIILLLERCRDHYDLT